MTTLDPAFPCLSPDSADPDSVSLDERMAELDREMESRRRGYPRRIDKGTMTAADAEFQIDGLAAIVADLHADAAARAWHAAAGHDTEADLWRACEQRRATAEEAIARLGWSRLVSILRREIAMRRRYYPKWVADGTLDAVTARQRLERIEAVHFDWWRWGRHFMPDDLSQAAIARPGAPRDAFIAAHRRHRARFAADGRRGEYAGTTHAADAEQPRLAFG